MILNSHVPAPFRFLMTAANSVAHGEAGANSTGPNNTTLFARELALLKREQLGYAPAEAKEAFKSLFESFPVATTNIPYLHTRSGAELIAIIFTAQYPLIYGGTGDGLFSGLERYQYLVTRLTDAAASFSTLPSVWGYVARKLALPMYPESAYSVMAALYTLPTALQAAALSAVLKSSELIVMSARMIADGFKASSEDYARKAKVSPTTLEVYSPTDSQIAEIVGDGDKTIAIRLPAISGNSLRHNLLRAPAATRLLSELGLQPDREIVPVGVERFLYSGGNTQKGAKSPAAADLYEARARERYPTIDALGGSTDQFVMTRSAVSIAGWIVCRENNWITERRTDGNIRSDASIFDLVTETTRTRAGIGGKDAESGQMIFSYETLAAGTPVLVEVNFQPFTRDLTVGSMLQSLRDWQAEGGFIGARSAQGHSRFLAEFPDDDRFAWADAYLQYLQENKIELAEGLRAATFGAEVKLCAA